MASAGPNSGGAFDDDAVYGDLTWQNPEDVATPDPDGNNMASVSLTSPTITDSSIRLILGDVVSGADRADGSGPAEGGEDYVAYGGEADIWDLALTPAGINATNFGVAFAVEDTTADISHYLTVTSFGFEIPDGATINGVVFEVKWEISGSTALVDHMRLTVHYTEAGGATAAAMLTLGVG